MAQDTGLLPLKAFDVELCRTGVGFATVQVQARSALEADELALQVAGDQDYSEKDAEYSLVHPAPHAKEVAASQRTLRVFVDFFYDGETVDGMEHEITYARLQQFQMLNQLLHEQSLSELRMIKNPEKWILHSYRDPDECLQVPEVVITRGHLNFVGRDEDRVVTSSMISLDVLADCFEKECDLYVAHNYAEDSVFLDICGIDADDLSSGRLRMMMRNRFSTFVVSPDEVPALFCQARPQEVQRG